MKEKFKNTKEKIKKFFNNNSPKAIVLSIVMIIGIFLATLTLVFALFIIISAPDFQKEKLYQKESTTIYALDGSVLTKLGKSNLTPITYNDLPEVLIDAIISTEDSRFFQHTGMDMARFIKASLGQVFRSSSSGGASTITMQVVKNTYTSSTARGLKGIIRKFTDIYMAIFKIENAYTKEEILEFYFNSQWLGYDGNINYSGISGVEQASEYYFGKSAKELSLPEASLIAGMFQNPVAYNPYKFPENARKRQNTVLNLMVRHGYITKEEKDDVLKIEIESLLKEHVVTETKSPQAAIDYVILEAEKLTGESPYTTPMKIYSTIDTDKQKDLMDIENEKNYKIPEARGDLQFGIAITSIEDGSITALSGGKNYQAKGSNRALLKRQPGSVAKPLFDYAPYIEYLNGSTYDMVLDEPIEYSAGGKVTNWDNKYRGLMTIKDALGHSRNTPSLRLFKRVAEVDRKLISDFVHNLGINYGSALYESASIGGFDGTSPLEISASYAAFGRNGYYIEPYSITKVELIDSKKVIKHKYKKVEVMSPETAYMITDILMHSARVFVSGATHRSSQVAAKTGTTTIDEAAKKALGLPNNAVMDVWTAMYTTEQSIGVWAGYDKLSKKQYGTSGTLNPVSTGLRRELGKTHKNNLKFKVPSGIIKKSVELETFPAQLPSPYTPKDMIIEALFKSGFEPSEVSTRYSKLENVTNVKTSKDDSYITISWDHIKTPDAINNNYLVDHFNKYYEDHATKYYEARLNYNSKNIGEIGYDIYQVINNQEKLIGRTSSDTFKYKIISNDDYTFIIKTSYSIFKSNQSSGVKTNAGSNNNVDDDYINDDFIGIE